MDPAGLLDAPSAALVIGGTLVATVLRCGLSDCRHAVAAVGHLGRRHFDGKRLRSELALQVRQIQRDGLLRADPHRLGDREFDEATDALIGTRSVSALRDAHETHKTRRLQANNRAIRTWAQASELAPVFGLAGTLVSLSQLPGDGLATSAFAGAISMAVLTTLYGLLLANLILAPLARLVERAANAEERERQEIVDWLAEQVAASLPRAAPAAVRHVEVAPEPDELAEAI